MTAHTIDDDNAALSIGNSCMHENHEFVQVVALTNGYHGDTLGVMDCCPRSVFNELQTPWYNPRGLFLEPPTCGISCGRWEVCHHLSLLSCDTGQHLRWTNQTIQCIRHLGQLFMPSTAYHTPPVLGVHWNMGLAEAKPLTIGHRGAEVNHAAWLFSIVAIHVHLFVSACLMLDASSLI